MHFPWCLKKCPYCDFLSVARPRDEIPSEAYADAVIAEFDRRRPSLGDYSPNSIFFGGGTPSLWAPTALGRVLRHLTDPLGTTPNELEITVECNPNSLNGEHASALADQGVGRLSIGLQNLDAKQLKFLGRLHSPNEGLQALEAAVASPVPRVSADLIFGISGQEASTAADMAGVVADLGPTHVSAYALTIEPGTEFGARERKGTLPILPDEAIADTYSAVEECLEARGFEHYEISNYATDGHHSEHNVGYWTGREYLGLGCGAWGTLAGTRYRNTTVPTRYTESSTRWASTNLDEHGPGRLINEIEPLSPKTRLSERILLNLRLASGFDIEEAARQLGTEAWPDDRQRAAARLVARGRLARDGSRIYIPKAQWLFADDTIARLM